MDAKTLFTDQMDNAENQLHKVFEGLPASAWDKKVTDSGMNPRETAAHLVECYVAGLKHVEGETYEWGSHTATNSEPGALLDEMFEGRGALKSAALSSSEPDALKTALEYGSNHDFYHVGQMCSLRLQVEPTWDPYSIYQS